MRLLTRLFALALLPIMLLACTGAARLTKVAITTRPTDAPPSSSSAVPTNTSAPCPVTIPNRNIPPGERPSPNHHGNGALWTGLWPEGKVVFRPDGPGFIRPDDSLSMKWPWWRGVRGKLTIEGRRLDGPAPPLRADIPEGYGDLGFQSTALISPTEGCWEVTGKVGEARLTFVTQVVKVGERK